jgi:two-component system sensor histidine kinase CpxA
MKSVFLKIFLWFWLTVVLVGVTLVMTTLVTSPNSQTKAEEWKASVSVFVSGEASRAVDIYERGGAAALRRHFEDIRGARFVHQYLLDETGREVLDQRPPQQAIDLASTAQKDIPLLPSYPGSDRFAAERLVGPSGREYVFFLIAPGVPIRDIWMTLGIETLLSLGAVMLVAGVFCFWLARHITAPVVQLGEAAGQIANGHLGTRVPQALHKRRDEIGVLGQHFDRMAERIESLVAGQQRLLSTVSHELRTPLTRLSLAAGLLRQCPPQETAEYLDRIELETEQLDKLIAQLLTLSRLESGADGGLAQEEIDLVNLIQEIGVDGNFEAQARSCVVCVGPLESCITTGIADQVRRAIENVVRNAIRYTKAHSHVEISMRRRKEFPASTALIQIRDYGPGVPDPDLAKIFRPFYRVPSSDGSNSNGTGLGLAITERIVRMHGGTVRAVNAPDGGLLVELTLPLKA